MVTLELETGEAIHLQSILTVMALHMRAESEKEGKGSEAAADLMKISLKLTTAILQSFIGG